MTNSKPNNSYLDRPLPAVYDAARDFHLVVLTWLREMRAPRSLVSPLGRATRRATLAIQVANQSRRYQWHLGRAKEELLYCLALFPLLADEGHLSSELCREAQRRIDQILIGVDQLSATPIEAWHQLQLPPLTSANDISKERVVTDRRTLEARIVTSANVSRFFGNELRATVRRQRKRTSAPLATVNDGDPGSADAVG